MTSVAKDIVPAQAKFKAKVELKNSLNAFSENSQVSQWRLRLDPELAYDEFIYSLRQDIKGKYSTITDQTYLDDTI